MPNEPVEFSTRACEEVLKKNLKAILVDCEQFVLKVGIAGGNFNGRKSRGGKLVKSNTIQEVSMYAAKNEFGSYSEHIPSRPFMRTTFTQGNHLEIIRKRAYQIFNEIAETNRGAKEGLTKLGLFAAGRVKKNIRDGNFTPNPPNAPSTIAAKGSDQQLFDTGLMTQSITAWVDKKGV
jgi:hypothetical protein